MLIPLSAGNDALRVRHRLEGDLEVVRGFAGDGFRLIDDLFGEAGELLDALIDRDPGIFRFLRLGSRFGLGRDDGYGLGYHGRLCDCGHDWFGCCFRLRRLDRFAYGALRFRPLRLREVLPLPQPFRLPAALPEQFQWGLSPGQRISRRLEWKSFSESLVATIDLSTPAELYRQHRAITFAAMQH